MPPLSLTIRQQASFLSRVWSRQPASDPASTHVCLGYRTRGFDADSDRAAWRTLWLTRAEGQDLQRVAAALLPLDDADVYFSPTIYSSRSRDKASCLPSQIIHADLDKVDARKVTPTPSVVWETSPGSWQALWFVDEPLALEEFERHSEALSASIGADHCWDMPHPIRVPGRLNWKPKHRLIHPQGAPGLLHELNWSRVWSVEDLPLEMPATPSARPMLLDFTEHDSGELVAKLPPTVRALLAAESGDRSQQSFIISKELLKAGLSLEQAAAVLAETAVFREKYANRSSVGTELSREIAAARDSLESDGWVYDETVERVQPPDIDANKEENRGEMRWAKRFLAAHSSRFIHTPEMGWFEWQSHRWAPVGEEVIRQAIIQLSQDAFAELPRLTESKAKALLAAIHFAQTAKGIRAITFLAQSMWPIARSALEFDRDPMLLAFPNGTLDLRTFEFRPGDPDDLITKAMGCDYDPEATCPTYDRCMEMWQPDPDMRAYIHRIGGTALEGRVLEQTLPVFYGEGANGKGTTLNKSWMPVFGDYCQVMDVAVLTAASGSAASAHNAEKVMMKGARLIITSEPGKGSRFSTGTLKLLTGGDPITARALYKMPITFQPTWQIIMMANHLPKPPAEDAAVWRRLLQVGWETNIPESRWDKHLDERLARELPGIANRLLEGLRDYRDNGGIRKPEKVVQATAQWRSDVDTVGRFLEDECELVLDHRTSNSDIWHRWTSWCFENGEQPGTARTFTQSLKRREGVDVYRTAKERGVVGVRLVKRGEGAESRVLSFN